MALNALGRLEVVFKFTDRSGAGTASAKRNMDKMATAAQVAGRRTRNAFLGAFPALLTLNIVRQVAGGITRAVEPATALNDSLRRLATFAGLSGDELESFSQRAVVASQRIGGTLAFQRLNLLRPLPRWRRKVLTQRMH